MKYKYLITSILLFVVFIQEINSQSGEWLNNRYLYTNGCRQNGMAGAGYSLSDDENLLFMNPAGLGIENKRFRNLGFSYGNSFEPHRDWSYLIQDHYLSFCFQPFKSYVGGLSFLLDWYMLTQGSSLSQAYWDPTTNQIIPADTCSDRQLNILGIIGYGRDLSFMNMENHSLGISAVLNSRYNTNFGEPAGFNSLHLNAGYRGSFSDFFHLGLVFINIPVIKSFNSDVTVVTPFCIGPSFGFSPVFVKRNDVDAFKMFTELSYKITIEKHENAGDANPEENKFIKTHLYTYGYEFGIKEILFLRNGYRLIFDNQFDLNKLEIAGGIGLNNRKHFELNLYFSLLIFTIDNADINPAKRFGLSISFFNLGNN